MQRALGAAASIFEEANEDIKRGDADAVKPVAAPVKKVEELAAKLDDEIVPNVVSMSDEEIFRPLGIK